MQTIPAGVPTFVDELQTLCLYKSSVGTDCVAPPSEALFGQYCAAGSSIGERGASWLKTF